MPTTDLTNPDGWQSVTLTQDEIWQCKGNGSILTTVEDVTREDQGIELGAGMVRTLRSGQTVNYRPLIPRGVARSVTLVREAL